MASQVWKSKKKVILIFIFRPSDYIAGSIMHKGKPVCKYDGTYCGFLNFDDVRYWDGRYM